MATRKKKTSTAASEAPLQRAPRATKANIPRPARKAAIKGAATDFDILEFKDAAAFRAWLKRNHAASPGIWIKLAKKGSGLKSITYPEAVDGALRWGWIDGQGKGIDDSHWLTKFTPRRSRSIWSKINREKVAGLIARGEMEAPGLAEIDRAKGDGRWDAAYDSPKSAIVPEDFAKALAAKPKAGAFFKTLNGANRYAILWRLQTAKRPETRAKRIAQFVAMLVRGETIH
jgi:uncharacterized protein YdeI (YjbR/CyaY-like superfamily)